MYAALDLRPGTHRGPLTLDSRSVDHVEPWMSGNARGPSTAFNLLYRLGQLKPTPKELRMMLDHKDSPYIRAVRWQMRL